ncbi:MAG TPA: hypothetical protein VII96_05340 [Acidimicrobiales bacterium]
MARRSVWLVTGVVAGAASSLYAERKLRRTVEAASARLQPDALAAEVGRTARQAVTSTGGRVRDAMASGREEKRRREVELWSELDPTLEGMIRDRVEAPDADEAAAPPATTHTSTRRVRRAARRSPSHLGK